MNIVNTYVRTLGSIGSYCDIDKILSKYSKNYMIDNRNLIFGLCSLIVKEYLTKLTMKTIYELEEVLKNLGISGIQRIYLLQ